MKKKKENRPKNNQWMSVLIFTVVGALCGYFGMTILDQTMSDDVRSGEILLVLAWILFCMYLTIFLQIVIHEGGHFIFGKLSGYQFVSFRVGNLMLVKEAGKYKFKKFTIAGTGGQCLMMPPKGDGYHYPYFLYNMGGSIMNILFGSLCLILYLLFPQSSYLSVFLVLNILVGLAFAFMNGIPLKLGPVANDGYNALYLKKDPLARHAFWLMLHINGLMASGTRIGLMPEKWFELPEEFDRHNSLIWNIGLLKFNYLHDQKQYEEARALGEYLLNHGTGLLDVHKSEIRCELLFYEMIGACDRDRIEQLYTKQLQKYVKITSSYVSRRRLLYAYELLVNQNELNANKQLAAFEKAAKSYPYPSEIESEREIIEDINKLAKERAIIIT